MLNEWQRRQEILRMEESRLQKEEKIQIENLNENIHETKRNSISNRWVPHHINCFHNDKTQLSHQRCE